MKIDRDEMAKPINPIRSSQIFQYVLLMYICNRAHWRFEFRFSLSKRGYGNEMRDEMAKQTNPDKVQIF